MKTVLITGACGGMGRATVALLRERGYRVLALDRRSVGAEENVIPICADLTDEESIRAAYDAVRRETERLDAIVHFAGIYMLDSLAEMETGDFDRIFAVNLRGAFLVNRIFLPLLAGILFLPASTPLSRFINKHRNPLQRS